jgi:hypothetical protein
MAFDLSAMCTTGCPCRLAYSKAARMIRSTPLRVLTSSLIATSSGVPRLNCPPMPT